MQVGQPAGHGLSDVAQLSPADCIPFQIVRQGALEHRQRETHTPRAYTEKERKSEKEVALLTTSYSKTSPEHTK